MQIVPGSKDVLLDRVWLGVIDPELEVRIILCDEEDMHAWKESKSREIEANEFAASLLMPYKIFIRFINTGQPTFDAISEVAKEFRTTLTATALRYVDFSKEPCALVVSNAA